MQTNTNSKSQLFIELATMPDDDARIAKIAAVIHGDTGINSALSCKLLQMGEAADRLSVSRVTLWRLVKAGRLSTVDIGRGSKRIPETDIIRFAQGGSVK